MFKCAHTGDVRGITHCSFNIVGRDLNCFDEFRYTPLQVAVENKHNKVAAELIFRGARINTRGPKGLSALHMAFVFDNLQFVDFLIDNYYEETNFFIKDYEGNYAHNYMVQLKIGHKLRSKGDAA